MHPKLRCSAICPFSGIPRHFCQKLKNLFFHDFFPPVIRIVTAMNALMRLAAIDIQWAIHKMIPAIVQKPPTCMLRLLKRNRSSRVSGLFSCSIGAILKIHSHNAATDTKNNPAVIFMYWAVQPDTMRHRAVVREKERKHPRYLSA